MKKSPTLLLISIFSVLLSFSSSASINSNPIPPEMMREMLLQISRKHPKLEVPFIMQSKEEWLNHDGEEEIAADYFEDRSRALFIMPSKNVSESTGEKRFYLKAVKYSDPIITHLPEKSSSSAVVFQIVTQASVTILAHRDFSYTELYDQIDRLQKEINELSDFIYILGFFYPTRRQAKEELIKEKTLRFKALCSLVEFMKNFPDPGARYHYSTYNLLPETKKSDDDEAPALTTPWAQKRAAELLNPEGTKNLERLDQTLKDIPESSSCKIGPDRWEWDETKTEEVEITLPKRQMRSI